MIAVAFSLEGALIRMPSALDEEVRAAVRRESGVDDAAIGAALCATAPNWEQRVCAARVRQRAADIVRAQGRIEPGAREVLAALHELQLPLAIAGNGFSTAVHAACDMLGFDGIVLASEDTGAQLPSPAAFAAITSAFSLPADCVWFVTARGDELKMARALGFETLLAGDGIAGVLDALREPYTQAALELRYVMRTSLQWRPGHTIEPFKPN